MIGLIGESGSGKTQLLMALTGMQDLTPGVKEGKIYYYDESQNKKNYLPDFNNRKWSLEKTVDGNYKRLVQRQEPIITYDQPEQSNQYIAPLRRWGLAISGVLKGFNKKQTVLCNVKYKLTC